MVILGIETSCDDTSASVLEDGKILSSIVSTQMVHIKHGGVIPELASRAHQKNVIPVIKQALVESGKTLDDIDAVGVTYGPGLIGALLVGVNTAKGLSIGRNIPLIKVNHIEGHIFANFIENEDLIPPFTVLVVSGGHTELIHIESYEDYKLLGKTRDDAAGECIDKVSKMLGLGFPGGRIIDELAKKGDKKFHKFPRGMSNSLDFSFSGLKTAVKVYIEKHDKEFIKENMENICASFLESVVDSLSSKLVKAAILSNSKRVVIAGGVSANSRLREILTQRCLKKGIKVFYSSPKYCTDNAAMIAYTAYKKYQLYREDSFSNTLDFDAIPGLRLAK